MTWGMIGGAAVSVIGGALLSDNGGAQATSDSATAANNLEAKIGQEQWERYKKAYAPLEDQYIQESLGIGSLANQNKSAQQAAADVAGTFSGAREQLRDNPGIDPGSQSYLHEANRLNLNEAATSAAAQTGARQTVQAQGRAAQTDALSLGKGLPAQASTALSSAASGLGAAGRYAQTRADNAAAGFGKAVGGITNSPGFKNFINGSGGYTQGGSAASNMPDDIDIGGGFNPAL